MKAVATVKGGLFETAGLATLSQTGSFGYGRRVIAQKLKALGNQELRARMVALNGVVPGSAVNKTNARVEASEEQGGKREIELQTLISRNSTADDKTEIGASVIETLSSKTSFGNNPVANKDGNPLGTR